MANIQRLMYRAHVLTWPAAIQIYNKGQVRQLRQINFINNILFKQCTGLCHIFRSLDEME